MVRKIKDKKKETSIAPGYRKDVTQGKETYKKKDQQEIPLSSKGTEMQTVSKGTGTEVKKEDVPTVPTFTPNPEQTTQQKIEEGMKSGAISNEQGNKLMKEAQSPEQMQVQERDKGIIDSIAQFGLLPAVIAGNTISKGLNFATGIDMGQTSTEEIASFKIGKALGLATTAAATVLAFKALYPVTIGKIGVSGRAGLSSLRVTSQQAGISMETVSKLTPYQKVGVIKKAASFIGRHKTAISGAQFLTAWLSSDNIISGASIQARDVGNAATFGQISGAEANDILDQLQSNKNTGTFFMKAAVYSNPFLLMFSKAYLTNASQAQAQIDRARKIANSV